MKKIICNTKLKKILIVLMLLIILSNYIPHIVLAEFEMPAGLEASSFYYKYTYEEGSAEDFWSWFWEVLGDAAEHTMYDTEIDEIGPARGKVEKFDIDVDDPDGTVYGWEHSIYAPTDVEITAMVLDRHFSIGFNSQNEDHVLIMKAAYRYREHILGCDPEKVSLRDAVMGAGEAAMTSAKETVEESEDSANLGGILLSPVFYLINFIADAVISNLGNIMTGEGLSLTDGIAVLSKNPPQSGYVSLGEPYEVDLKSFLPNLLDFSDTPEYQYPNLNYTPETIFMGGSELFRIDFVTGSASAGDKTGWGNIRDVVAQWYNVLRMAAVVGLLAVLIYTGIKIIISANAKDKAKYKEWIGNWFMAVAILFSMHIIMAFIVSVTGQLSNLIGGACQGIPVQLSDGKSFTTNLMGLVRFMIQSENFYMKIGYEVMYIALIVYTIKFTIVYLKRTLNMAFLTLIAPLVALMYPIDKINDGRSQAFDMWLKEYTFNALLQPMHQIMYYILVGSAVRIAASNPIYGIVVLAFMTEAEKLLKKIFGFDKASGGTVGGMTGAFAAGALASNIKNIAKLAGGKGNGGKGADGSGANNMLDNPKPTQGLDVDAFGDNSLPTGNSDAEPTTNNNEANKTAAQNMFDADEENGEFDDDPAYREAMAREAYGEQQGNGLEGEDLREHFRNQGYSEEEINDILGEPEAPSQENSDTSGSQTPTEEPIEEVAKKKEQSRFAKGMANVGKKIAKPVWDFDHGAKYNGKRLFRNVTRGALGVGLGIGAAALQAGISITDGKYNPMEGVATFAAGYAGAGQIVKGVENIGNTYTEGALDGDKKAIMERAKERWADREDVIAFNKSNYKPEERKEMARKQSEHLLQYGFNLKEMKSVSKYAEKLMKPEGGGLSEEKAYKQAANTYKLRQEVQDKAPKSIYNSSEREKYIETMLKGKSGAERDKLKKAYENGFNSILAYDKAQQ